MTAAGVAGVRSIRPAAETAGRRRAVTAAGVAGVYAAAPDLSAVGGRPA